MAGETELLNWKITSPVESSENGWVVGFETPTHHFSYVTFNDAREAFTFVRVFMELGASLV